MHKKWLLIVFILSLMFVIMGCSAKQKPAESVQKVITLKFASFAPAATVYTGIIEEYAKSVEERTEGKVKIEVFPGGTLLEAVNVYDGVLEGIADIGLSATAMAPNRFPLLTLFELPFSFSNSNTASSAVRDIINEFEHDFLKEYKVIFMFAGSPRYIATKEKIENLEDLKGKEIRAVGDAGSIINALGAVAVGMPIGELAGALQTGIVEGYITTLDVLRDLKFAEYVNYVIDFPVTGAIGLAVMDLKVWDTLPQDIQQAILEVGLETSLKIPDILDNGEEEALQWAIREHGVEVIALSSLEKAKWDAATEGLFEKKVTELELKNLPARVVLKRIYELLEKYEK